MSTNQVDQQRAGFGGLVFFAFLSFILPLAVVGLTVAGIGLVDSTLLTRNPAVLLPIVLLGSVLALIGGLSFLAIVMYYLRLTSRSTALGLPDGSVRAVIAISLLFLFTILSVSLYFDLRFSNNLMASADVAKQLITTVATLAVSVAGFYFGTSSVTAATRAVARVQPSLRVTEPPTPQYLSMVPGSELKGIRLISQPAGEPLSWRVIGDDNAQLTQTEPSVFRYERGPKPSDNVNLVFSLLNDPTATTVLEVRPEKPPATPSASVQPESGAKAPSKPPAPVTDEGATKPPPKP